MKLVVALRDAASTAFVHDDLRARLRDAGATRLQVNLDDDRIPESALRVEHLDPPISSVVSVWTDDPPIGIVDALRPLAGAVAAWQVEESQPLAPPEVADGVRLDGLAQVSFLRRPAEMAYDDWCAHWQGPHAAVAVEAQGVFGYVQNRVVAALTDDTPHVDGIAEELFPSRAMSDLHAYYGSDGDPNELDLRLMLVMESAARMGADHDLDVVPTGRYTWDLRRA